LKAFSLLGCLPGLITDKVLRLSLIVFLQIGQ